MLTRYFALIFGIAYVATGLLGFIPGAAPHGDMPPLAVDGGSGYLLGLFPVNVLHNIVHLAIGAWGIASYANYTAARAYGWGVAIF